MAQTQTAPSNKVKENQILTGALIVAGLVLAGVMIWVFSQKSETPVSENKGVIYYTGPKYNINTGKYVDAAGHIVPPPPGEEGKVHTSAARPKMEP